MPNCETQNARRGTPVHVVLVADGGVGNGEKRGGGSVGVLVCNGELALKVVRGGGGGRGGGCLDDNVNDVAAGCYEGGNKDARCGGGREEEGESHSQLLS